MGNAMLSLMEKVVPSHASSKKSSLVTKRVISINEFPDEILLKILSHLTAEELCLVIADVCERWNAVAKDVVLWKNLTYTCDRVSRFTSALKVLERAPNLKSFVIRFREDAVQLLEFLFGKCDGIKRLEIYYCYLGVSNMCVLDKIVAFYPELEELGLVGCFELTSSIGSTISQLRKLRRLNLSDCTDLSGCSIKQIVENCTRLEELCLQGINGICDKDVIHIIRKVGPQLTTLKLDGINIRDNSFCYLHHCT
ncbi:hypothetical protein L9F63_019710, partial [Diploptera punctata]